MKTVLYRITQREFDKAYCSVNFIVCAHSTQTKKFVLQGLQGGPLKKCPIIERTSFIIKLALPKYFVKIHTECNRVNTPFSILTAKQ